MQHSHTCIVFKVFIYCLREIKLESISSVQALIARLPDREREGIARVRVAVCSIVGLSVDLSVMPIVREAIGLDDQRSLFWESKGREIVELDGPGAAGVPCSGEDPDLFRIDVHCGVDIEGHVGGRRGTQSVARHLSGVILVYLVFSVGIVPGTGARVLVWGSGLAQQACQKVVELAGAQPIASETDGVVSFELGKPPNRTGRVLLAEDGVLVDIDLGGGLRQAILSENFLKPIVGVIHRATAGFHVPGPLVGDRVGVFDVSGKCGKPSVAEVGLARGGWPGYEQCRAEFIAETVVGVSPHVEVLGLTSAPEDGT